MLISNFFVLFFKACTVSSSSSRTSKNWFLTKADLIGGSISRFLTYFSSVSLNGVRLFSPYYEDRACVSSFIPFFISALIERFRYLLSKFWDLFVCTPSNILLVSTEHLLSCRSLNSFLSIFCKFCLLSWLYRYFQLFYSLYFWISTMLSLFDSMTPRRWYCKKNLSVAVYKACLLTSCIY